MAWSKAKFKGKDVWVETDSAGQPIVKSGRVPMRYSASEGAKIYGAGASRVEIQASTAADLPEGISADAPAAARKTRGSGFGKAGTRTKAQAVLAAAAARELIGSLPADTVVVFTDGACKGNPGPAGSGAWVRLPDGRTAEMSRSLGSATNNVGELTAVGLALDALEEAEVPPEAPVALFTDSQYSNGVLCQGWKAKANRELILGLRVRIEARPGLTVHWIAGHVGVDGNERADALANDGVAGISRTVWT